MSLGIDPAILKPAIDTIADMISALDMEKNIRFVISGLQSLANKTRAIAQIYDTPEISFVTYLVWDQMLMTRSAYAEKKDEWYEMNSDAVKEFRAFLREFLVNLRKAFEDQDYQVIIDAVKEYFYRFDRNTDKLSSE